MPGGIGGMLVPLILIGGMMFMMTRSQKKQQQQRQQLLDGMAVGSEVVTIGGLYGVISEINQDKGTVTLDCEGIFLEFERQAIKTVKPASTVVTSQEVKETEVIDEEDETVEKTEEVITDEKKDN
ncbi:preprotein translocase subunit YajC [Vagococcus vulneris]|uniref:Preprotein translocase subunit YajC n=1 Tax=Vagococcus vulneris TaxID=1977869 RepID=A0A429ZY66_9ENTE|nr:preprotein translocase subunit YajC [Vagococcus vulneris]RST98886.1 preprotein translocase subunit YajC [Vagococcus vulneris]